MTLIGLVAGMWFTVWLHEDRFYTWLAFILLTVAHVLINYMGMRALNLRSLNRQRAQILCDHALRFSEARGASHF